MMDKQRKPIRPSAQSDLRLSNGAMIDFKIANDETGTPVVSQLVISFDSSRVPAGGIGGSLLREIKISELLAQWFQESSRSFLNSQQESALWRSISGPWSSSGRTGVDDSTYAALSYFYIKYCERHPNAPTARLAAALGVSPKTLSTRLAQCRKLDLLTSEASTSRTGKAHGQLTNKAKKLISTNLERN
jgi:hypothetical protein